MAGQLVGQSPSQISPVSTVPLPQLGTQSASLTWVQVLGQQRSPATQAVWTALFTHRASQVAALPERTRSWQPIGSHLETQLPSHRSPGSTTPLPQLAAQSESFTLLQPGGQQPSPLTQAVTIPEATHAAWHVPAFISEKS